ncbi:hypothetical protein HK104_007605 [Borealophlyctis nickersoniae]|nr:hypothetical protein HK104_007605 [Borealophlyctis nickersoniae]
MGRRLMGSFSCGSFRLGVFSGQSANFVALRRHRFSSSAHLRSSGYWDDFLTKDKDKEPRKPIESYRRITAAKAAKEKSPPRCTRMLVRDFIDDALYNPNYGYFSKKAPEDIDFNSIKDNYAFMNHLAQLYKEVEGEYNDVNDIARQVWHTPTELFKPWYGYAMATRMVSEFKRDPRGASELVIYEIGAGNGTLMVNILDYIKENEPELYKKTRYNIIEISTKLAERQAERQDVRQVSMRHECVNIINQSIFTWNQPVPEPCFFLATEVIDNFAHDLVRYDITGAPLQGVVLTDEHGDYQEAYEHLNDPLISRFMDLRSQTGYRSPLTKALWKRKVRSWFPFAPNMSPPEFLPVMCLQLFERLNEYFPEHRLIISDFSKLPEAVEGIDAPVVQTRYKRNMVPCSTYLVQPGWFDIFFPTNFELMRDMYNLICAKDGKRAAEVMTQKAFLERYGNVAATRTRSGENPMLMFYENFKFLLS